MTAPGTETLRAEVERLRAENDLLSLRNARQAVIVQKRQDSWDEMRAEVERMREDLAAERHAMQVAVRERDEARAALDRVRELCDDPKRTWAIGGQSTVMVRLDDLRTALDGVAALRAQAPPEELRALSKAATSGPWEATNNGRVFGPPPLFPNMSDRSPVLEARNRACAAFIAAAVNHVRAALDGPR